MDVDGLPLVGPGVDYSKVQAIQQKRILTFINQFLSYTVCFLNRFSQVCETKLEALNVRIQKLEASMSILEAKLSSVPGLEDVKVPAAESMDTCQNTAAEPRPQQLEAAPGPPPPPVPEAPEPEPVVTGPIVSQDLRYARFFKMVQVGVPPPAVKMKMQHEGLNPDLLDTPDAPAPSGGQMKEHSSDSDDASVSSFSD